MKKSRPLACFLLIFIVMDFNVRIHPNKVRQVLFLSLLLLVLVVLCIHFFFLLSALLGAITLYVLLRKPMIKMTLHWKWKTSLSAIFLMLASLVAIVLPFGWLISIVIDRISPFLQDPNAINHFLVQIDNYLQQQFNFNVLDKENLAKLTNGVTSFAPKLLGSTLNMLTNLVVMYFVLYFMLTSITNLEAWVRKSLPLQQENKILVLSQAKAIISSNAIGIPIVAALQGLLAVLGYYLFGVSDPVMWGIMAGICSVIPFVGTMATWVPIAVFTFAQGDVANGIWLIFWGLIVIGTSDNILRFILQKKLVDIHPMITVFGVIVGLDMFGFWGVIFGPLLLSLFILLVRVYINEFINSEVNVEAVTEDSGGEKKDK